MYIQSELMHSLDCWLLKILIGIGMGVRLLQSLPVFFSSKLEPKTKKA